MPDFEGFMDKAKEVAGEHPDQVKQGVEKAEQAAEEKLGGQFTNQIDEGGNAVEGFLGVPDSQQQQGS